MNNQPVETFSLTRKTKQCARSRFVQHKTKQLCSHPLEFVQLPIQLNTGRLVLKKLFSALANKLNTALINKVDMVCFSPVGFDV